MRHKLGRYELSLLQEVGENSALSPYAYIAWENSDGEIEFGPVRWKTVYRDVETHYSASPFPGAWSNVPEGRILRVRHPDAM